MDLREQFEYPPPVLSPAADKITCDAAAQGVIEIKNTGGGVLYGRISCNHPALSFTPQSFEGNEVKITYQVSAAEETEALTDVLIQSNGGEKKIPFAFFYSGKAILTRDGAAIRNLREFFEFAKHDFSVAAEKFKTVSFRELLLREHFSFMEMYENLIQEKNSQQALESFLILSDLKKPIQIIVAQTRFTFKVNVFDKNAVHGSIAVRKRGWGFLPDTIKTQNNAPWLTILTTMPQALQNSDEGVIEFLIDPQRMASRYEMEKIMLTDKPADDVSILAVKVPPFKAQTNKEVYAPGEEGSISVHNNTGGDLLLEVLPSEGFVRFEAKKYFIAAHAEIPFQIKMTAMQTLARRKHPLTAAMIDLYTTAADVRVSQRVKIIVGDSS